MAECRGGGAFPPPPGNVLEAPGFRPMLQIGCADPECRRCLEKRGGIQVPVAGCLDAVWYARSDRAF